MLKKKLLENGIDENEIAFIHHANSDIQKKELFAKVREGKIRNFNWDQLPKWEQVLMFVATCCRTNSNVG